MPIADHINQIVSHKKFSHYPMSSESTCRSLLAIYDLKRISAFREIQELRKAVHRRPPARPFAQRINNLD